MSRVVLPSLELTGMILCDDIRREQNGKFILIGVYGISILCNEFPAQLNLHLFCSIQPTRLGDVELEFQFCLDEKPLVGAELLAQFTGLTEDLFSTPALPVTLKGPGTLSLRCREARGDWTVVLEKTIDQLSQERVLK